MPSQDLMPDLATKKICFLLIILVFIILILLNKSIGDGFLLPNGAIFLKSISNELFNKLKECFDRYLLILLFLYILIFLKRLL